MTIKMPVQRPSFFACIDALRLDRRPEFEHIHPTVDEADAADALEIVHQHHYSDAERPDAEGEWGPCRGCSDPWPCKTWRWGDQLALLWIGRAHNRYMRRAEWAPAPQGAAALPPARPQRPSLVTLRSDHAEMQRLRAVVVSAVYCRNPDCRTVVTLQHPLEEGYLHDAVCLRHEHTNADRYRTGEIS